MVYYKFSAGFRYREIWQETTLSAWHEPRCSFKRDLSKIGGRDWWPFYHSSANEAGSVDMPHAPVHLCDPARGEHLHPRRHAGARGETVASKIVNAAWQRLRARCARWRHRVRTSPVVLGRLRGALGAACACLFFW